MKPILTIISLFAISLVLTAQEVKFGDVTLQELEEKQYAADTSAHAAVLYYYRNSYFSSYSGGTQLITEVQKRIKIYDQQGYDYATEEINLFKTRGSNESVGRIKAYTYNLENGKIVKTELDKDQIFETEIRYNYDQVKFTMPNVQEGSVVEFKYKITSPYTWSIDEFRFQDEIPIKKIEARLSLPKGFVFKPTYKGYLTFYPQQTKEHNSRINMTMIVNTFHLHNVPALKEENFVDNIDNYRAGVVYELVSIQLPEYNKSFAKTWKDVAQSIGNTDDYEKDLDKSNAYDEAIDALIADASTQMEKTKRIFNYVKENITWNGIDGKYYYYGTKKALKEKKGNSGDINLTLVSMLRYAGIEAHPVVISTKDNAIPFFPTLDRLNYVVAYAKIDDQTYFMDATDEFSNLNLLPIRDYNWEGVLINNPDMVWRKIQIKRPEMAVGQHQISATLSEDGSIEGSYNCRLSNHHAKLFRENVKDQDIDLIISQREEEYDNIEISDYELKNTDSCEGYVSESFNFYHDAGADVISDKLYIKPLSFLRIENNPFKSEERKYPIDFGYAYKDQFLINITIPEGYEPESEIKPILLKTPDQNAEFVFRPNISGQNLQLSVSFKIKQAMMSAETYLYLKEFFNQVITKGSEQIVLRKTI